MIVHEIAAVHLQIRNRFAPRNAIPDGKMAMGTIFHP